MTPIGHNHPDNIRQRLSWLRRHQPHNKQAILALERRLSSAVGLNNPRAFAPDSARPDGKAGSVQPEFKRDRSRPRTARFGSGQDNPESVATRHWRDSTTQPLPELLPYELNSDYADFVHLHALRHTTNLWTKGGSDTRFRAFCWFLKTHNPHGLAA